MRLKFGFFSLPVTWEEVFSGRMDKPMTVEERVRSFVEQIKNPYCFRCGDAVVKTSFLDTDVTLEDAGTFFAGIRKRILCDAGWGGAGS